MVPDHDTFVRRVQSEMHSAVGKLGMPKAVTVAQHYDVSATLIRKLLLWEPEGPNTRASSFNFRKLLDAYDFAVEVNSGRIAKGKCI